MTKQQTFLWRFLKQSYVSLIFMLIAPLLGYVSGWDYASGFYLGWTVMCVVCDLIIVMQEPTKPALYVIGGQKMKITGCRIIGDPNFEFDSGTQTHRKGN